MKRKARYRQKNETKNSSIGIENYKRLFERLPKLELFSNLEYWPNFEINRQKKRDSKSIGPHLSRARKIFTLLWWQFNPV